MKPISHNLQMGDKERFLRPGTPRGPAWYRIKLIIPLHKQLPSLCTLVSNKYHTHRFAQTMSLVSSFSSKGNQSLSPKYFSSFQFLSVPFSTLKQTVIYFLFCSVASVVYDSLQLCGLQPARLHCPWEFLGRIQEWVAMILLTQGLNLRLLCLLHCRQIFLHTEAPGKAIHFLEYCTIFLKPFPDLWNCSLQTCIGIVIGKTEAFLPVSPFPSFYSLRLRTRSGLEGSLKHRWSCSSMKLCHQRSTSLS